MASTPLNKIEKAHQLYREGLYKDALGFYTEALSLAKTKPQKIALHSNRAACYLKLHHFDKAAEECTSVLELDRNHTGALMLRAQTLVTLKEYNSALFDVNRLIELNPSSEVYQSLQTRLKTQLSLAPIPETEEEEEEEEEEKAEEELNTYEGDKGQDESKDDALVTRVGGNQKAEVNNPAMDVDVISPKTKSDRGLTDQAKDKKAESKGFTPPEVVSPRKQSIKGTPEEKDSKGWQAIPKPKGHSTLDYARWERVEDDSSEEDDGSEEESEPQYRFRVRTVGVQSVK